MYNKKAAVAIGTFIGYIIGYFIIPAAMIFAYFAAKRNKQYLRKLNDFGIREWSSKLLNKYFGFIVVFSFIIYTLIGVIIYCLWKMYITNGN